VENQSGGVPAMNRFTVAQAHADGRQRSLPRVPDFTWLVLGCSEAVRGCPDFGNMGRRVWLEMGRIVFTQGRLNTAGDSFNRLNGPYDAKVIGNFTGLTPPSDDDDYDDR
jgi:hypothetical protein